MASSIVNDIITHIEGQMAAALPVSYSKLSHVIDVAKNKFKGASNRYGTRPLSLDQNNLNLGNYTVDHNFELILTNSYKSSKLVNDEDMRNKAIILQDYMHDCFKRMYTNRDLIEIKQVFNLTFDEPEYDADNHLVIQRATITIKYQRSLRN